MLVGVTHFFRHDIGLSEQSQVRYLWPYESHRIATATSIKFKGLMELLQNVPKNDPKGI